MVHDLARSSPPTYLNDGSMVTVRSRLLLNIRMLARLNPTDNPILRAKVARHQRRLIPIRNNSRVENMTEVRIINSPTPVLKQTPIPNPKATLPSSLNPMMITISRHCRVLMTCSMSVPDSTQRKRHLSEPCSAERKRSVAGLNYNFQH